VRRNILSDQAPEFLRELADHAAQILTAAGMDEASAIERGQEIAARVAKLYGGTRLHIPKGTANGRSLFYFELSKRDLQIYREFTGANRDELAARYGISVQQLYAIVQAVRVAARRASEANRPLRIGLASDAAPKVAALQPLTPIAGSE